MRLLKDLASAMASTIRFGTKCTLTCRAQSYGISSWRKDRDNARSTWSTKWIYSGEICMRRLFYKVFVPIIFCLWKWIVARIDVRSPGGGLPRRATPSSQGRKIHESNCLTLLTDCRLLPPSLRGTSWRSNPSTLSGKIDRVHHQLSGFSRIK